MFSGVLFFLGFSVTLLDPGYQGPTMLANNIFNLTWDVIQDNTMPNKIGNFLNQKR
jgi:hypothetical protein